MLYISAPNISPQPRSALAGLDIEHLTSLHEDHTNVILRFILLSLYGSILSAKFALQKSSIMAFFVFKCFIHI